MEIYLTIITTVLVVTQIIRLIQNTIQLRKQDILFKEQLGQIQDVTQEDFDIQRKAYRLLVEHFESKNKTQPTIRENTRNVIKVCAEAELDDMYTDRLDQELKNKLAEELWQYADVYKAKNPCKFTVGGKAEIYVADRR